MSGNFVLSSLYEPCIDGVVIKNYIHWYQCNNLFFAKLKYLATFFSLTLFVLMDFPIYIDIINMYLSILYFKGAQVKISKF